MCISHAVKPMYSKVFAVLVWAYAGLTLTPGLAAPRTPMDPAEVLERLPTRAGAASSRELAAMRAAMMAAPGNPAPAADLAQGYFDRAMARGDSRIAAGSMLTISR